MREPKAHFFVVLAGLLLALEISRKISWALGCGAAIFYVGALRSPNFPVLELLAFSSALGSCLIVTKASKNDIKKGLEILEVAGMLCAAYAMLLQFPGTDPIVNVISGHDYWRVSVFFGQHTLYGPFCVAAAAPALFRGRYFRAALMLSPVPLIDASFTYLALGALLALYFVFRVGKPAAIALMLLAAIAGAWAVPKMLSPERLHTEALNDNGRYALWGLVWQLVKKHPYVGRGTGSFAQQFPIFQIKKMREAAGIVDEKLSPEGQKFIKEAEVLKGQAGIFLHPHNEVLYVLYEFGILGLLVVLWILFVFWMCFVAVGPSVESCSLLAIMAIFLANSMGNFAFHLIPQALIPIWAFTAMTSLTRKGILDK